MKNRSEETTVNNKNTLSPREMPEFPDKYTFVVEDMPGREWEVSLPLDWIELSPSHPVLKFFSLPDGLKVGVNAFGHKGHIWIHASISHPDRLPSYSELCLLKEAVFGRHGICAQVFEAEENHVNIHPNCLHLWGPLEPSAWPLPRFTGGTI